VEHQQKILPKRDTSSKSVPAMKSLILSPIGYPLRANSDETSPFLITDDPSLFQHYARSQWLGLVVKEGSFLFDSLLFPDYAFRAKSTIPNGESQITKNTHISLFSEQLSEPPMVKVQEKLNFSDIVGQEDAKKKCQVIARFLSNIELMQSIWAPKNILFWGPPGNGKTMMAKALSYETEHSMLLIKASDLLGIYVGDGARKIRNIFSKARKKAPAIIFIDELDSIALKRNFQSIRGDVVELVSALLGEMDGIEKNHGVVTIASTNQPKLLDAAIVSRFEELLEFKLPDAKERLEILKKYAKTSPIPFKAINWDVLVEKTMNWSGRDLKEKIIKNAIHYAVLRGSSQITMSNLKEVMKKVRLFSTTLSHYS
jgi:AAA family ATPase